MEAKKLINIDFMSVLISQANSAKDSRLRPLCAGLRHSKSNINFIPVNIFHCAGGKRFAFPCGRCSHNRPRCMRPMS